MVKSKYVPVSGKNLIKLIGIYTVIIVVTQKGSHIKIRSLESGTIAIVPDHQEIRYGTFKSIMRQLRIEEIDFLEKMMK